MGLPCSKAVCSLPELVPSVPSQALAPRPGFNGHKPSSSFLEGEGWLDKLAINKINKPSATHSPESETALAPFIPKPAVTLQAPRLYPCLPFELFDTARHKRCPDCMGIVSILDIKTEGLHLPTHLETFSPPSWHLASRMPGYVLYCWRHTCERWLRWKPPDVRERKHSGNVVKLKYKKMSGLRHSLKPITALSSFTSKPAAAPQALTPLLQDTAAICRSVSLLPVQPARCAEALSPLRLTWEMGLVVPRKLPVARERKQCISIVNNKIKEVSAEHSPGHNMALLRSA
jgi:hypothetical protein